MHKSVFLANSTSQLLEVAAQLKLDSAFVGAQEASPNKLELLRGTLRDTELYAKLDVFAGEELLRKYPDAVPVESMGKATHALVCPTHPGVRQEALDNITKLLETGVDGIWLDYVRYPTHWQTSDPEILDTCYCARCLTLFEEHIGEPIEGVGGEGNKLEDTALFIDGSYYHEWLEFKAEHIASFVREVRKLIDASGKKVKLGLCLVPWKDKEHGAGIQRVVAQDFIKLTGVVDVFSPMLYHAMCGKSPEWVKDMVEYYWALGAPYLPFVQTENKPQQVSPAESSFN